MKNIKIDALILAGGLGSRMGNIEKALVPLRNQKMLDMVLESLLNQTINFSKIWLNINRNFQKYDDYKNIENLSCISDLRPNTPSPLAGIEAGLTHSEADYLLIIPCDMPTFPKDLCEKLFLALTDLNHQKIACAKIKDRREPLLCLCHKSVLNHLKNWLNQNKAKVQDWQNNIGCIEINFLDNNYRNINTPQELKSFIKLKVNI